jgi:hypothetical protein
MFDVLMQTAQRVSVFHSLVHGLWTRAFLVTFVGTCLVGAFVGVFTTRYGERARLRRYSKLRLSPIVRREQKNLNGETAYFWRLPIRNLKIHAAYDVLAECIEIRDEGSAREGTVVAPLNWAHNPPNIYTRTIFRDQTAYLDLFQIPSGVPEIWISCSPIIGYPVLSRIEAETSEVRVLICQRSGQRIELVISTALDTTDARNSEFALVSAKFSRGSSRFWHCDRQNSHQHSTEA